ncbi:MAG: hypothetical protein GVY20_13930 [Bacteroidetes bacterium]|jgi:hypothetical protein|nr:hypothetical protein [Bacteroidota bacterium]
MEKKELLFNELPRQFKRMEAKRKVREIGRSRSWFNQVLEDWLFAGKVERIDRGLYQKTG